MFTITGYKACVHINVLNLSRAPRRDETFLRCSRTKVRRNNRRYGLGFFFKSGNTLLVPLRGMLPGCANMLTRQPGET